MKEVHALCAGDASHSALLVYRRTEGWTNIAGLSLSSAWGVGVRYLFPCIFDAFFDCYLHIGALVALPGRVDTRCREYRENVQRMKCMM